MMVHLGSCCFTVSLNQKLETTTWKDCYRFSMHICFHDLCNPWLAYSTESDILTTNHINLTAPQDKDNVCMGEVLNPSPHFTLVELSRTPTTSVLSFQWKNTSIPILLYHHIWMIHEHFTCAHVLKPMCDQILWENQISDFMNLTQCNFSVWNRNFTQKLAYNNDTW